MTIDWRVELSGDDLNDYEKNYQYLLNTYGVQDALAYAIKHFFQGFGGYGGRFSQAVRAKGGDELLHKIANTFGGGKNESEGVYPGNLSATYKPRSLAVEIKRPPRPKSGWPRGR